MSDETPGVGQGALPPREGQGPRNAAERPTMRLAQVVGGPYIYSQSAGGVPALTQISPGSTLYSNANLVQGGAVTRIISINPSRVGQTSQLRPSLANKSIVNVLRRPNSNVRLQVFPNTETATSTVLQTATPSPQPPIQQQQTPPPPIRSLKRPLSSSPEKKDTYASKLQRVMNHKLVRSKLVKEKYNEHLLESFYLEAGGNILDLYQFAKRPRTQAYLAYLKEHAIDPKEYADEGTSTVPPTTPSTPTATAASSLPGITHHTPSTSTPVTTPQPPSETKGTPPPKPTPIKVKSSASYPASTTNQEQIVEKAKQEAYVVQRIAELQKEGLWSEKRLPKVQEMSRSKAHWDYLLEEMVWLAADFAQERKWKKAAAKKCARMVQKYFQDKAMAAQRAEKAQEQHLRRIAAFCAKEIKNFWNNVEKLVEYKQNTILEEKRKKALDQQLSFIVDQTEKYSQLLAEGMNKSVNDVPSSTISSRSVSRVHSDEEFEPETQSDEDDEETIEQEEAHGESSEQSEEIAALQRESQMDLDDLLEDDLIRNYLLNRDNIKFSESDESDDDERKVESKTRQGRSFKKQEVEEEESVESDVSDDEEDEKESEEESEMEVETAAKIENQDGGGGGHDELKMLVEDSHKEGEKTKTDVKDDLINDAAAIAESIQPKGNTLSSTDVSTKVPFLLKFPLREYQHIGLDWLVTMYDRKLNGILADEMGLGKTIQTISLLAHLACEKENWGPHLIVVPTSVMLNWEMECKKWCPAFKILTYYGTQKERKLKRTGWTKPNAFHICITSYKLVIQDHQSFRRKKWKYLILDEAQNIKNFKSQRWQLLLNFQTQQRLLLTGTPLQNNLMELWSLMHFLMPNVFQSHREFKEWFSNPVTGMIEGNSEYNENIIKRLHKVLRPFLLRRLKSEVEKQMPKKYEHVVMCRLSKRQRFLYDDYMSRAKTRETLASGNLLSVINVLMQLRKVCNHPNLFEVRPTISPFQCEGIRFHIPSIVYSALEYDPWKHINLYSMNFVLIMLELHLSAYQCYRMRQSRTCRFSEGFKQSVQPPMPPGKMNMRVVKISGSNSTCNANNGNNESNVGIVEVKKEPTTATVLPALQLQAKALPQNVKVKVSQQYGVQLLPQQVVKAIPVVNISQATSTGGVTSVTSVDKISASFAQLVQTSTGKHLLLTSNPNITGNIPVSTTTTGGQKLTLLSKQPVSTTGNAGHQITKAFVKFQLTSVTTATTATTITTSQSSSTGTAKTEETKDDGRKTVGVKYIDQLFANQSKNLDVRWDSEDSIDGLPGEADPKAERERRFELMACINERRCSALPLYGRDFQDSIKIYHPNKLNTWMGGRTHCMNTLFNVHSYESTDCLKDMLQNPERRIEELKDICDRFIFYVPAVKALEPEMHVWHPAPSEFWGQKADKLIVQKIFSKPATPLHHIASAMVTQFPDPRLIQYDCGKLQTLDKLLRNLKINSHRVLIFTQMTKMLDVLEAFLNFHGHIYLRLDGTTRVDQRQVLMERFNGDKRIFAFILSTRSGGIGVNLTGADTVIFYDSDWNPTMDAQAQDRCHRIGQTRDVHIYRLISERTIEENILKKANQKRMLGDLAIEGGNFTTAYFKSSTIQDLFNIDNNEESAANRMSEVVESSKEREKRQSNEDEKVAVGVLEHAMASCEDDQDVIAARTAKAEAVADLAEFDENIPLDDQEKDKEPELSRAEQEIDNVIKKLSPIERYAMRFIEETESAWSVEQLKAAEQEIEKNKLEWEQHQLAAMREEEERRARELEEENDMLTFSREDATNQIWVSDNTGEQMPMWCPPTPPEQNTDVYIDHTMSFLYDMNIMSESQLPPIYVKKETKRARLEAGLTDGGRPTLKMSRKEDVTNAPKSLFHTQAMLKMRRDMKLQKYRNIMRMPLQMPGKSTLTKPISEQQPCHEWTIHEDMALLKLYQSFQLMQLNLSVMSPGHTVNWDFVADYVNTVSITYRSPKQCKYRYETTLMQREEGKQIFDATMKKKKNKNSPLQKFTMQQKSTRPMRTSQLYTQDNNATFSQLMIERYEALKSITNKRPPPSRQVPNSPATTKNKHTSLLSDCGIDLEHPVLPVEVAARRAERIAKDKINFMKAGLMANSQAVAAAAAAAAAAANAAANGTQATVNQQQVVSGASVAGTSTSTPSGPLAVVASSSSNNTNLVPVTSTVTVVASVGAQVVSSQTPTVVTTVAATVVTTPGTPPNTLRTQRIIASPSTVVSVSGLSPAQLQHARLIAGTPGQAKTVVGATATMQGKTFTPAQLQVIRQTPLKQQLRIHPGTITTQGGVKTSTVTIGGQQAVVQFTQSGNQPRQQFVRQGVMTVRGKGGVTQTVADNEAVTQLIKKHQLQQQQKMANVAAAAVGGGAQGGTVQSNLPQVFAQALQQAGPSGTPVATLVKAVSSSGVTQTVTIPVTNVTLTTQGKTITSALKNPQQLRQLQIQQQLLKQNKLGTTQKLSIAQVGGKNAVSTPLIFGATKPISTAMTVQQLQQVIRAPLNVSPGPVVLAKGPPRVIPVNTAQGTKHTIQVVAATSQALNTALRPQAGSPALAGALSGVKVQGATSAQAQQALLSVALNQNVRQGSPVRIQTSSTPIVAVTVQSATAAANVQQTTTQTTQAEQVSRFMKK